MTVQNKYKNKSVGSKNEKFNVTLFQGPSIKYVIRKV